MKPPPLTPRERQALEALEQVLRQDRLLDRRLRSMGAGLSRPCRRGLRNQLGRLLLAPCAMACLVLLSLAVATNSPAWITAFALVWPATLLLAAALLRRRLR